MLKTVLRKSQATDIRVKKSQMSQGGSDGGKIVKKRRRRIDPKNMKNN